MGGEEAWGGRCINDLQFHPRNRTIAKTRTFRRGKKIDAEYDPQRFDERREDKELKVKHRNK